MKIALITTEKGVVSGVTIFMDQMKEKLEENGYEVELIRPVHHSFWHITSIMGLLGYALTKEQLRGFDLIIGNGLGLAGAVDLPVKIINNIHSTNFGATRALRKSYEERTKIEEDGLDHILGVLLGKSHLDIPAFLAKRELPTEIAKVVAKRADITVCVSPATKEEIVELSGVERDKVIVVPNSVDGKWFNEREFAPIITQNPVNVIYTGRAAGSMMNIFLKGFDRILAAMKEVKGAQPIGIFHLGSTEIREKYSQLLEEARISYVYDVENKALPSYLRAGDIYIHTSRYEAHSLSIMEAMASGLVPVVFPSGMNDIQIENGKSGYIVHSIDEMNEKINFLIENADIRIKMGQEASRTIREEYSSEKMFSSYLSIIREALKE